MEYNLKSISKAGIAEATAKVELYRYLNEPEEAESICRDILAIEPQHQLALRLLGLSITDQFSGDASDRSREVEQIAAPGWPGTSYVAAAFRAGPPMLRRGRENPSAGE
jgi:hypothetical protein